MYDKSDLKMFGVLIVFILLNTIGLIVSFRIDQAVEFLIYFKMAFAFNDALFVTLLIYGIASVDDSSRK